MGNSVINSYLTGASDLAPVNHTLGYNRQLFYLAEPSAGCLLLTAPYIDMFILDHKTHNISCVK